MQMPKLQTHRRSPIRISTELTAESFCWPPRVNRADDFLGPAHSVVTRAYRCWGARPAIVHCEFPHR